MLCSTNSKENFFSSGPVLSLCRLEREEEDEEDEGRKMCVSGSERVRPNPIYKDFKLNQTMRNLRSNKW